TGADQGPPPPQPRPIHWERAEEIQPEWIQYAVFWIVQLVCHAFHAVQDSFDSRRRFPNPTRRIDVRVDARNHSRWSESAQLKIVFRIGQAQSRKERRTVRL